MSGRLRRWWDSRRQPARSAPLVEVHEHSGRLHILANVAGMDALRDAAGPTPEPKPWDIGGFSPDRFSGVDVYVDTCPCEGTGQ